MIAINVMTKDLWQRLRHRRTYERLRQRGGRHKPTKKTPEYIAYRDAKHRCTNPKDKNWKDYGGRDIRFLFTSFKQFFAHIGPRPEGKTLDRINNASNYEIGNVRWATWEEQAINRRKTTFHPL